MVPGANFASSLGTYTSAFFYGDMVRKVYRSDSVWRSLSKIYIKQKVMRSSPRPECSVIQDHLHADEGRQLKTCHFSYSPGGAVVSRRRRRPRVGLRCAACIRSQHQVQSIVVHWPVVEAQLRACASLIVRAQPRCFPSF